MDAVSIGTPMFQGNNKAINTSDLHHIHPFLPAINADAQRTQPTISANALENETPLGVAGLISK
jgi:hypothetical protein